MNMRANFIQRNSQVISIQNKIIPNQKFQGNPENQISKNKSLKIEIQNPDITKARADPINLKQKDKVKPKNQENLPKVYILKPNDRLNQAETKILHRSDFVLVKLLGIFKRKLQNDLCIIFQLR